MVAVPWSRELHCVDSLSQRARISPGIVARIDGRYEVECGCLHLEPGETPLKRPRKEMRRNERRHCSECTLAKAFGTRHIRLALRAVAGMRMAIRFDVTFCTVDARHRLCIHQSHRFSRQALSLRSSDSSWVGIDHPPSGPPIAKTYGSRLLTTRGVR